MSGKRSARRKKLFFAGGGGYRLLSLSPPPPPPPLHNHSAEWRSLECDRLTQPTVRTALPRREETVARQLLLTRAHVRSSRSESKSRRITRGDPSPVAIVPLYTDTRAYTGRYKHACMRASRDLTAATVATVATTAARTGIGHLTATARFLPYLSGCRSLGKRLSSR